jgi:hypothetical protein
MVYKTTKWRQLLVRSNSYSQVLFKNENQPGTKYLCMHSRNIIIFGKNAPGHINIKSSICTIITLRNILSIHRKVIKSCSESFDSGILIGSVNNGPIRK